MKFLLPGIQFAPRYLLSQRAPVQPKLPPELERQIFEICALDCPKFCTTLILVSKRVYEWIDPILISVVCFDETLTSRHTKLKSFLAKLTSGKKPVEYYARHVKNVAFLGGSYKEGEVDKVLDICTGVENLVIKEVFMNPSVDNPRVCSALRRLHINLWWYVGGRSNLSFEHSCFGNLTHLQLTEDDEMWQFYTGWEHLSRLSHFALACRGSPWELDRVVQALSAIRYVALCHYYASNRDNYINFVSQAVWGLHVVFLARIPFSDWERGARGEGDFWDKVEDEVERRLRSASS